MLMLVQKQLIDGVVETYSLAMASDTINGVSYAQARAWLENEEFKAAYGLAMEEARDRLLGALYLMAHGTEDEKGNPSAAAALIKMSGGGKQSESPGTPKPLDENLMDLNIVEKIVEKSDD